MARTVFSLASFLLIFLHGPDSKTVGADGSTHTDGPFGKPAGL